MRVLQCVASVLQCVAVCLTRNRLKTHHACTLYMAIPDPLSWALYIHRRALYINQRALYICKRAQHIRTQDNGSAYPPKKPCSPAKEPYTWTKEPYVSAKEPYTFELKTMDQHIPPKRQYSPAKEPYTYIALPYWMRRHRMRYYRVASWDVTLQSAIIGHLLWKSCVRRMISCIGYRYIHRHLGGLRLVGSLKL